MNYNESIKNYFLSFLDSIQKLNAMEAELEQIKILEENLVLDSVFNSLPEETFKSETKNLNEIKDWIHSQKAEIYNSNKSLFENIWARLIRNRDSKINATSNFFSFEICSG